MRDIPVRLEREEYDMIRDLKKQLLKIYPERKNIPYGEVVKMGLLALQDDINRGIIVGAEFNTVRKNMTKGIQENGTSRVF